MSLDLAHPIQLLPVFRERIWGRESLLPYFPRSSCPDFLPKERIGEVWFTFKENSTSLGISLGELIETNPDVLGSALDPNHPGVCPLLVKLLFTTERLSVQVHPDDAYAELHHGSLGKTEAWYVLEAEPSAEIALGFREPISAEKLKETARSGKIEQLLDWRSVRAGDIIYAPAGTVHAIGAGLTICEIQENSDITYRLYDYGRARELHLERAAEVSRLGPHESNVEIVSIAPWRDELVTSSYFRIERLRPARSIRIERGLPHYLLLLCLKGSGSIGPGHFAAGQCWIVPAGNSEVEIAATGSEWILAYTAPLASKALQGE